MRPTPYTRKIMFSKKLTLSAVLLNLLLILPSASFAAISEQNQTNFKNIYGSEIKPELYAKIMEFCEKNDTNLVSCMEKLKAKPSKQTSAQSLMNYNYCCVNVSNQWGEHAYIHGQDYCFSPC